MKVRTPQAPLQERRTRVRKRSYTLVPDDLLFPLLRSIEREALTGPAVGESPSAAYELVAQIYREARSGDVDEGDEAPLN